MALNEKVKVKAAFHPAHDILTLVALLLPVVGIIIGALYLTKDNELDHKLGEHLVAFSLVILIAAAIVWYVYFTIV